MKFTKFQLIRIVSKYEIRTTMFTDAIDSLLSQCLDNSMDFFVGIR